MNSLKRLIGRLLTYFGGLLIVLGVGGIFYGMSEAFLLAVLVAGAGFALLTVGIIMRW